MYARGEGGIFCGCCRLSARSPSSTTRNPQAHPPNPSLGAGSFGLSQQPPSSGRDTIPTTPKELGILNKQQTVPRFFLLTMASSIRRLQPCQTPGHYSAHALDSGTQQPDVYLLRKILHDWPADRARHIYPTLLARCVMAAKPKLALSSWIQSFPRPGPSHRFRKHNYGCVISSWRRVSIPGRENWTCGSNFLPAPSHACAWPTGCSHLGVLWRS